MAIANTLIQILVSAMERNANREKANFWSAMLISDICGLSSFHWRHVLHRVYRWSLIVAIAAAHVILVQIRPYDSSIKYILFTVRFWCLGVGSVIVLIIHLFFQDAIEECHSKCSRLPAVFPARSLSVQCLIFVSHFFIYQIFYRAVLFQNFLYAVVMFFITQVPAIQMNYLIGSVRERIRELNLELGSLARVRNFGRTLKATQSNERARDERILEIHEEFEALTELAEDIASTYSCQVLITLTQCSLEILFILQITFFDILRQRHFVDSHLDFLLRSYIVLSFFCKLAHVTRCGEEYSKECKRMNGVLCQVMSVTDSAEIRRFMVPKLLGPPPISVLGLFELNYEFLYTLTCGTINYSLVVAMFHLAALNKHGELSR